MSLLTGTISRAVVAPGLFVSKYDPKKKNTGDIEPLKELYLLFSKLDYVLNVTKDHIDLSGMSPPKGYLVAYQPEKKKPKKFTTFQSAIDHCASGGQVCIWYEYVESVFSKGASKLLDAFIKSVDESKKSSPRKKRQKFKPSKLTDDSDSEVVN